MADSSRSVKLFDDEEILAYVKAIYDGVKVLAKQESQIMATLADIKQNLREQRTLIDGLGTILTNLKAEIEKLKLNPVDQAAIDDIFAEAEANKAELVRELAENTPSEGTV